AAALYKIESIIGSCPAIAILGFVIALISVWRRSTDGLLLGLWCPVVTALIAFSISAFQWSPRDAKIPVCAILVACAVVASMGATVLVNRKHPRASDGESPSRRPPFQFSVRRVLLVTALLSVLCAAMQQLRVESEWIGFAIYGATVLLLSLAVGVWYRVREDPRVTARST
ncbi:MAG: hypothetical protein AAF961_11680, partial [Planctomycetota bacterium]